LKKQKVVTIRKPLTPAQKLTHELVCHSVEPPDNLFYFLHVFSERCKISTTEENARKKRILLVDDELDITLTIKTVLEESEFLQVEAFYDPALALLRFKAGAYDLALLDISMPEMSGFQLFRKLREIVQ
jgi:PleD family two-component response regulator